MVKEKGNELFFRRVAKMSACVVQISDCHLFTDPSAELRGVQPHRAVWQALQHVTEHETACDYLVISGDLAHDEQRQTYQVLREMLGSWLPRCRLIPGNHDDRQFIHEVFAEIVPADTEAVCFEEDLATWRMMGLDSHVPGEVHGELAESQWRWLEQRLAANRDQPTILFMHHPPFFIASAWLDEIALRDGQRLTEMLNQFPQVRVVSCGHVHQEFQQPGEHALLLTTPSVAVQFRPGTETPEIDSIAPGYRVFDLHEDGNFETHVVRIPGE